MPSPTSRKFTIAGAGLAGALLATLLAREGFEVEVLERRPDPRAKGYEGGRSINLALAERGLNALRMAGLDAPVLAEAVMMRGRMVHFDDGRQQLQRYGRDDSEVIWSVQRGRLNLIMLDAAEAAGATLRFSQRIESVDFDAGTLDAVNDHDRTRRVVHFDALLGADGAGSAVRQAMARVGALEERFEPLGHGYKELEIPVTPEGEFRIEPNALHIWPRGGYMCIALPNAERNFTVTLFLPNLGPHPSFETVHSAAQARALFEAEFADALPLIPALEHDFAVNPVGQLGTLYLDNWHLAGRAVLVGDAAHAMVPFHGQGMNCAFEDCVNLAWHLRQGGDLAEAFAAYQSERMPNALAIQHMALENYVEMRDRVDDADYLLQRALEVRLAELHPERFVPRYAMVSFRRVPYRVALERGQVQRQILVEATQGRERLEDIDLDAAARLVNERLTPLA